MYDIYIHIYIFVLYCTNAHDVEHQSRSHSNLLLLSSSRNTDITSTPPHPSIVFLIPKIQNDVTTKKKNSGAVFSFPPKTIFHKIQTFVYYSNFRPPQALLIPR